MVYYNQFTY